MRIRQILLAHTSRAFRGLIKKYVFSELNDTEITDAGNMEETLIQIHRHPFDVVLVSTSLNDMPIADFKTRMARSELNAQTPLIVLAEHDSDNRYADLIRQGFEHVVYIRLRPGDLIKTLNKVCNPRAWRKDERYHIPNARVLIYQGEAESEARVINISRGGILVELVTRKPDMLIQGMMHLTLQIEAPNYFQTVSGLNCRLLRLHVIKWRSNHCPDTIRATFIFVDLAEEVRSQLDQILQMAREGHLCFESEEMPGKNGGRIRSSG